MEYANRDPEEFKAQSLKRSILHWPILDCSYCHYPCGYLLNPSGHQGWEVKYDAGCRCLLKPAPPEQRTWQDVADHYNRQDDPTVIQRMDEFWRFPSPRAQRLLPPVRVIHRKKVVQVSVRDEELDKTFMITLPGEAQWNYWKTYLSCECKEYSQLLDKHIQSLLYKVVCRHIHAAMGFPVSLEEMQKVQVHSKLPRALNQEEYRHHFDLGPIGLSRRQG